MLIKHKGKRVLGVDHSTMKFAYSLCVDGKIEYWGEIDLEGSTAFDRIGDLHNKLIKYFENEKIDKLVIEKTTRVNSQSVALKMGMVAGVIIGYFAAKGVSCDELAAISWQAATAKPTLTKIEKAKLKKDNPGRSVSWLTGEARKIRKQRIIDWVYANHGINAPSDAADAICVSLVASERIG